jgi:hypothetical protein
MCAVACETGTGGGNNEGCQAVTVNCSATGWCGFGCNGSNSCNGANVVNCGRNECRAECPGSEVVDVNDPQGACTLVNTCQ